MKKNRIVMGIMAGVLMLAGLAFTATPANAQHFSVGIGLGGPAYYVPPPVVYRPPYPGPGYYWNDGYYDPYGVWVAGFWGPRVYRPYGYGFVGPRYGRAFYGNRGFVRGGFGGRGFDRGRRR